MEKLYQRGEQLYPFNYYSYDYLYDKCKNLLYSIKEQNPDFDAQKEFDRLWSPFKNLNSMEERDKATASILQAFAPYGILDNVKDKNYDNYVNEHFYILSYKIEDNKLFISNHSLNGENRKKINVEKINNIPAEKIIEKFRKIYPGISDSNIQKLLLNDCVLKGLNICDNTDEYKLFLSFENEHNVYYLDLQNINRNPNKDIFLKDFDKENNIDSITEVDDIKYNNSEVKPVSLPIDAMAKCLKMLAELDINKNSSEKIKDKLHDFNSATQINYDTDRNIVLMMMGTILMLEARNSNQSLPDFACNILSDNLLYSNSIYFLDKYGNKVNVIRNRLPYDEMKSKLEESNSSICTFFENKDNEDEGEFKINANNLIKKISNSFAHSQVKLDYPYDGYAELSSFNKEAQCDMHIKISYDAMMNIIDSIFKYKKINNSFPMLYPTNINDRPIQMRDDVEISDEKELSNYLNKMSVICADKIKYNSDKDSFYPLKAEEGIKTIIRESQMCIPSFFTPEDFMNDIANNYKDTFSITNNDSKPLIRKLRPEELLEIEKKVNKFGNHFYQIGYSTQSKILKNAIKEILTPNEFAENNLYSLVKSNNLNHLGAKDVLLSEASNYSQLDTCVKTIMTTFINSGLVFLHENGNKGEDVSKNIFSSKNITLIENNPAISFKKGIIKSNDDIKKKLMAKGKISDDKLAKILTESQNTKSLLTAKYNESIFNMLRDSIAHKNISFPNGIDMDNYLNTVITFDDYNSKTSKKWFKATFTFDELLDIICDSDHLEFSINKINESKDKNSKEEVKTVVKDIELVKKPKKLSLIKRFVNQFKES